MNPGSRASLFFPKERMIDGGAVIALARAHATPSLSCLPLLRRGGRVRVVERAHRDQHGSDRDLAGVLQLRSGLQSRPMRVHRRRGDLGADRVHPEQLRGQLARLVLRERLRGSRRRVGDPACAQRRDVRRMRRLVQRGRGPRVREHALRSLLLLWRRQALVRGGREGLAEVRRREGNVGVQRAQRLVERDLQLPDVRGAMCSLTHRTLS
ncbi:MAG: hypothetical protein JWP87_4759 [Labilithrix sp.]|nr:hypothetical protein [Labilithrix sp.]